MKENNLYGNIVCALTNCLKNEYLKSKIILDTAVRKKYLEQIGIMLGLEKEYDCKYKDDHKYVIDFAQALANMTDEVETIERPNDMNFDKIDQCYIEFVNYMADLAGISKGDIKNDGIKISPELIDELSNFTKIDASRVVGEKEVADKQKSNQQQASNGPENVATGATIGGAATNNQNNNGFMNNNGGNNPFNQQNMMNMMAGQNGNLPVHPRVDPRFYPYTSKPRWMEKFKKLVAYVVLIGLVFTGIIAIIGTSITASLNSGFNDGKFWVNSSTGQLLPWTGPNLPGGLSADSYSLKNLSLNMVAGGAMGYVTAVIIIIFGCWMFYNLVSPPRLARDKFVISRTTMIINIIICAYCLYFDIQSSVISGNLLSAFTSSFAIPDAVKNMHLEGNIPVLVNNMLASFYNNSQYSLVKTLVIISLIFLLISIVVTLVAAFISPRIDREKILRANAEYQKAIEAAFRGERYEMDPSLYDDENSDDNGTNPPKKWEFWKRNSKDKNKDKDDK